MKTPKRKQRESASARVKAALATIPAEARAEMSAAAARADVAVEARAGDVQPADLAPGNTQAVAGEAVDARLHSEAGNVQSIASEAAAVHGPGFVLASHCGVKDAAVLKDSLGKLAAAGGPVSIDIRNVERVDTSTLQLLCALAIDCRMSDQRLTWSGHSQVLRDAARLLGVTELLALPQTDSQASTLGAAA